MKQTRKMSMTFKLALSLVLLIVTVIGCMMTASAEDLEWNLLTDVDAGYKAENAHGVFDEALEEDGTKYVHNTRLSRGGAYYIYDDENILGTYRSFSLEGDFYFESLPSGVRVDKDGTKTPKDAPLSFLCWAYKSLDTGAVKVFNALRIDDDGRLYLPDGTGLRKTTIFLEVGKWYNIKILMMPENGLCELYIDGENVEQFNIVRYDVKLHKSAFVRYFDGFYQWGVQMKNLIVKTDSSYIVGLREEEAADYIGYQTTKPEDGEFSLRTVLGVNSTEYNRIGYEVLMLQKDDDLGEIYTESLSVKSKVVYETLKDADGNTYSVKDLYGYNYAAALEIEGIPEYPGCGYVEIVVRPYILGMNGIRMYGKAAVLIYYGGDADENGYPVAERRVERFASLLPEADTFIFAGGHANTNFGTSERLQSKNMDASNVQIERASYFKFHFTPEQVKLLESATSAKFAIYSLVKSNTDYMLHGTDTKWEEDTLTYNNHPQLAATWELIDEVPNEDRAYMYFDVLQYLNEQMLNEDGSLTVSFRVTNKGASGANLTYIEAKEKGAEYTPKLEVVATIYDRELQTKKISNVGYEAWGYAEYLVDEWFDVLVDKVFPKDENGNLIEYDVNNIVPDGYMATEATGDFTTVVEWEADNYIWVQPQIWGDHPGGVKREDEWEKERFTRTLSTLGTSTANAFLTSEYAQTKTEYDTYGGISNAGFKGKETGFFHTEVIGDRTYIIDPLGNPFFVTGINDFTMYNSKWALEKYGSEADYYTATTKLLKDMGLNAAFVSPQDKVLAVDESLTTVVQLSVVGSYMFSLGRSQIQEGYFPHNNTINVFDPDFRKMTNKNVAETILSKNYQDNPRVLGYVSDNELPGGDDILTRYLTIDPNEPSNAFSYAVAWTWLARRMNNPVVSLEEYLASPELAEMNGEFLGFIYCTYYGVTRDAIEAVDPNHMYMGSRVTGGCGFHEGYLRAAGYQLDIITTNIYGGPNYDWEKITNYYRYSGKPIIITEFFAKAMDAIDENEFIMANSTGAGFVTKTQQMRADFYEHHAINLLQTKACVGWVWYCMLDNDQPLHYSINLQKEVVMAYVAYAQHPPYAESFIDRDGKVYTDDEVGFFETIDEGNPMMSNHNCNKGVFNRTYNSTVSVYSYDANGKLLGAKSYWVEDPESAIPADGTKLKALSSDTVFTVGKAVNADGSYTETVLTNYQGTYVALARAMRKVSDNLIGLVKYFDAQ